ncbi:hypothetical protein [Azospirillum sp. SYSU D00513]|uniref:hypothetical protein n=1 Tax=Azospirillum sp. SYSU D00513 TaxID=2812561 RepID=UPI001A958294|nr:hypothetical protein [Azospirillum sp. SYSU D00513]
MIRQTRTASRQVDDLLAEYMRRNWDEAIMNLDRAFRDAIERIEADPTVGAKYPRPYPELEGYGFLWIESHIYWIGYSMAKGYPVITNFFNKKHDIINRIAIEDEEIGL